MKAWVGVIQGGRAQPFSSGGRGEMCEKGRHTTKGGATDSVLASVDTEQSTERVHEIEAAVAEQPGRLQDPTRPP